MADWVLKVAYIIKSVTNATELPSSDLEIIFLHSLWVWLNYFASSNTVIAVSQIQISVFSCLEKCTNLKLSRADASFSSATSNLRLLLETAVQYSSSSLNNTSTRRRHGEQLQSCCVKHFCLNCILKGFVMEGQDITYTGNLFFSCKHHNPGILRVIPFTPLVFHLVIWRFRHSCLYIIMKGSTIRPPHSTLHHSAGLCWMLDLGCFSRCCLKALSMSDISTFIKQVVCSPDFLLPWFIFNSHDVCFLPGKAFLLQPPHCEMQRAAVTQFH